MSLSPWKARNDWDWGSPFAGLTTLRSEMDRLFDDFFGNVPTTARKGNGYQWMPALDVKETPEEFIVTADLPGIDASALDISYHEGTLTLKGERRSEEVKEGDNFRRVERSYGSFARSLALPDVKDEQIEASYRDGVLTIRCPRSESAKRRSISVKTG